MNNANYNIISKPSVDSNRNLPIQILRVSACLIVFLVHFGQRTSLTGVVRNFTDFGAYGVHLFFLISGFLACKTFFRKDKVDIKKYYIKRAIAILPLYYLVIAYYFVTENILNQFVSVIPPDNLGVGWFRYIFVLNGFLTSDTYFWRNLGATWTIPVFCVFYLIVPWVLKKRKSVFSVFLIWVVIFVGTHFLSEIYSCPVFENLHYLFLGCVLFSSIEAKSYKKLELCLILMSIGSMILQYYDLTITFIFSLLILIFVTIDSFNLPKKVQKIIDCLDKYSYTLYLMHCVVFCSLLDRLKELGVQPVIIGALAIIGTVFATWIVGKYLEKPIQRFLRKKLNV